SIHPQYLDAKGIVALWREALLAQAVLRGETRGYRHHPQLERFRAHARPPSALATYLAEVHAEAVRREYMFDATRIGSGRTKRTIAVTSGQIDYEWRHLMEKLRQRAPELYRKWRRVDSPEVHPLFVIVPGDVESWERIQGSG
ncbi:MAG: pyrimidine dimer DNA glycosylase/endonuclease V, partial [Thermoanaerobaculia bacterium]